MNEKHIDKLIKACESGDEDLLESLLEEVLQDEIVPKKPLTKEQKDRNKSIWDKISD